MFIFFPLSEKRRKGTIFLWIKTLIFFTYFVYDFELLGLKRFCPVNRKNCIFAANFLTEMKQLFPLQRYRVIALFAALVCLNLCLVAQTTVYQKDKWGAKLYYFDETNTMRIKDKWGDKLFYFDGKSIRQKDKWGQPLAYMDGNTVRLKDQWGEKLYFFDGNTIRQRDQWGEKLYYLDGNVLKMKDKWGTPVFYFDGIPERWMIVCVI